LITMHGRMHKMYGAVYLAMAVGYASKMFMKLNAGVNVIKLFFIDGNKVECLYLEKLFIVV